MDGTHRAMGNGAAVAPEEVSMASRGTTPRPEADPFANSSFAAAPGGTRLGPVAPSVGIRQRGLNAPTAPWATEPLALSTGRQRSGFGLSRGAHSRAERERTFLDY